jgi:hypothetical protein
MIRVVMTGIAKWKPLNIISALTKTVSYSHSELKNESHQERTKMYKGDHPYRIPI